MPPETNHEVQLSRLLAALSNPAVRHFIELLALERRPSVDLRMHFDLTVTDIIRLGQELGMSRSMLKLEGRRCSP